MKHVRHAMIIIAGALAAAPAWAQSPSIAYSFHSIGAAGSGTAVEPPRLRAPGADALRWLGGLGSTQAEPNPAPISAGASSEPPKPAASDARPRRHSRIADRAGVARQH